MACFVITVAGEPIPHAVVRVTETGEEAFTHDLRWAPSDLLSRVPDEPSWTVVEHDEHQARNVLISMATRVRSARYNTGLEEFTYYLVFNSSADLLDLDLATMLIRQPQPYWEEVYTGYRRWDPTSKLNRINDGTDWPEDYVLVSAEEAERFRLRKDRQHAESRLHYLVTEDGRPTAVAVRNRDSRERDLEWADFGFGWQGTDLVSGPPQPGRLVEEIDYDQAVEHLVTLTRRSAMHPSSGYTDDTGAYTDAVAAFAVFREPIDVLDKETAYDVVRELRPEHEIFLPLAAFPAEILAKRIRTRSIKRRAEPVDGHHYLAVFPLRADDRDLGNACAVVRFPDCAPTRWQTFLSEGTWVPGEELWWGTTLPLNRAELDRITRRLATADARYFHVRHRETGPVALVRLTGNTEHRAEDLGWVPSDFLTRWRDEPDWIILETNEEDLASSRRLLAAGHRSDVLRENEYVYVALFHNALDALALANPILIGRRKGGRDSNRGITEELVGPGRWEETGRVRDHADPYRRTSGSQEMPITEEELHRLTAW